MGIKECALGDRNLIRSSGENMRIPAERLGSESLIKIAELSAGPPLAFF